MDDMFESLLSKMRDNVNERNWLQFDADLEELIANTPSDVSMEVALLHAEFMLPIIQFYIPDIKWIRSRLDLLESNASTNDVMFTPIPENDFHKSIGFALDQYYEGLNFLLIASDSKDNPAVYARKMSIAIFHFLGANISEFEGARNLRTWSMEVTDGGVIERIVSKRTEEIWKYKEAVWLNFLDTLQSIYKRHSNKIARSTTPSSQYSSPS